jgi:hypothetical protein
VWHKDTSLGGADVVILPGGFSHGDYLRTGAIARFSPVMGAGAAFAAAGRAGARHLQRLPDPARGGLLPGAMLRNRGLKFRCEHVHVRVEQTDTPFTRLHAGPGAADADRARRGQLLRRARRVERARGATGRSSSATRPPTGRRSAEANPNGSSTTSPASATRPQRRRPDAAPRARVRAARQRRRPRAVRVGGRAWRTGRRLVRSVDVPTVGPRCRVRSPERRRALRGRSFARPPVAAGAAAERDVCRPRGRPRAGVRVHRADRSTRRDAHRPRGSTR